MPPNLLLNQSDSTAGSDCRQDQRSPRLIMWCNEILGRHVSVHQGGQEWRKAMVKEFDITTRQHKLQFEDGEEWTLLDSHRTRLIDAPIMRGSLSNAQATEMPPSASTPAASTAMLSHDGLAREVLEKKTPAGHGGDSGNLVGSRTPVRDTSQDAAVPAQSGLRQACDGGSETPSRSFVIQEQPLPSSSSAHTDTRQSSADGNSISGDASLEPQHCPSVSHHGFMLLGSRISLLGSDLSTQLKARVTAYDLKTSSHRVCFDNGLEQWLSLKAQRFSWVSPRGYSAGSVALIQHMRDLGAVNIGHTKGKDTSAHCMPYNAHKEDLDNPSQLIGRKLSVLWQATEMWCPGELTRFNAITGHHHILYNDGEEEWLHLSSEQIRWAAFGSVVEPPPAARPVLDLGPSALSTLPAQETPVHEMPVFETPGSSTQLLTPIVKRKAAHVAGGHMGIVETGEAGSLSVDSKRMRFDSPVGFGFGSPLDLETASTAAGAADRLLSRHTPRQSPPLMAMVADPHVCSTPNLFPTCGMESKKCSPNLFPGMESNICSPSRSRPLLLKTTRTSPQKTASANKAASTLPPLPATLHFGPSPPQSPATKPPQPGSCHTPATQLYAHLQPQRAHATHCISRLTAGLDDEPEMGETPEGGGFVSLDCPQQSKLQLQLRQLTGREEVLEAMHKRVRVLASISAHLESLEQPQ